MSSHYFNMFNPSNNPTPAPIPFKVGELSPVTTRRPTQKSSVFTLSNTPTQEIVPFSQHTNSGFTPTKQLSNTPQQHLVTLSSNVEKTSVGEATTFLVTITNNRSQELPPTVIELQQDNYFLGTACEVPSIPPFRSTLVRITTNVYAYKKTNDIPTYFTVTLSMSGNIIATLSTEFHFGELFQSYALQTLTSNCM